MLVRWLSGTSCDEVAWIYFLVGKDGRFIANASDGIGNLTFDEGRVSKGGRIGNRNGGE